MNIIFMGGKQAGCLGLLTVLALNNRVLCIIAYDEILGNLADELKILRFKKIRDVPSFYWPKSDLLVSVHGREIVSKDIFGTPKLGAINTHPCLWKYKGKDPIGRLIDDRMVNLTENNMASVGIHRMTDKLDEGEVLVEEFVDVTGCETREEIYNALYPYYSIALIKAMRKICS